MMLRPTIAELTKGKINRYELAIATAKCACRLTDNYNRQKELAEKAALAGKDTDFVVEIDKELEDKKAVRVAIDRIYSGQYEIVRLTEEQIKAREEEEKQRELEEKSKIAYAQTVRFDALKAENDAEEDFDDDDEDVSFDDDELEKEDFEESEE